MNIYHLNNYGASYGDIEHAVVLAPSEDVARTIYPRTKQDGSLHIYPDWPRDYEWVEPKEITVTLIGTSLPGDEEIGVKFFSFIPG